jgi:hypothetical protein
MIAKFKRLLASSPAELRGRSTQEMWKRLERMPFALERPLVDKNQAVLLAHKFISGQAVFFPGAQQPEVVPALVSHGAEYVREVLDTAHGIQEGRVPVLGFGPIFVGSPPRWHVEPISGRESPERHWSLVPYLDQRVVGDHKILWEFNRHQYLVTLSQAWRLTGDVRWLDTMQAHMRSWMHSNPVRVGVNWASSLEVAYRAISWLWSLRVAGRQALPHLDNAVLSDIVRMLQAHGRHVERYLSTWFSPNTHLTGEALGLLYLAVSLPELPESQRWLHRSLAVLRAQLFVQLYDDGVYFEQATQYHRYTCDIYLHALVLASEAGVPLDGVCSQRVHRAFTVLRALQRPDGTMALLGDDDGGRLVQLDTEKPHELNGLLMAAATWFQDASLLPVGESHVQRLWMLGMRDAPEAATTAPSSAAFSVGGQFVMADQDPSGGHLTLSCGPHGALSCGHSHSDELSFELWTGGAPLIVDRGTYAYDGVERNAFRSTAAHNTLELANEGVSLPGAPFSWRRRVDATCTSWVDRSSWTWFEGYHDGYTHLAPGARHSRFVWRPTDGLWVVGDTIANTAGHDAVLRWHVTPNTELILRGQNSNGWFHVELKRPGASPASILLLGATTVDCADSWVSTQYGRRERSTCLTVVGRPETTGHPPATLTSIIVDWAALAANSLQLIASRGATRVSSPTADPATPHDRMATVVLDAEGGVPFALPPDSPERLLAFQNADASAMICIGRAHQTAPAFDQSAHDRWYEGTRVRTDEVTWVNGSAARPAG